MHLWTLWICLNLHFQLHKLWTKSFLPEKAALHPLSPTPPAAPAPLLPFVLVWEAFAPPLWYSSNFRVWNKKALFRIEALGGFGVQPGPYGAPCSWLSSHLCRDNFCLSSCWFLEEKINRHEANSFIEVGLRDGKGLWQWKENYFYTI